MRVLSQIGGARERRLDEQRAASGTPLQLRPFAAAPARPWDLSAPRDDGGGGAGRWPPPPCASGATAASLLLRRLASFRGASLQPRPGGAGRRFLNCPLVAYIRTGRGASEGKGRPNRGMAAAAAARTFAPVPCSSCGGGGGVEWARAARSTSSDDERGPPCPPGSLGPAPPRSLPPTPAPPGPPPPPPPPSPPCGRPMPACCCRSDLP